MSDTNEQTQDVTSTPSSTNISDKPRRVWVWTAEEISIECIRYMLEHTPPEAYYNIDREPMSELDREIARIRAEMDG